MHNLFLTIFYQPILNLIVFLHGTVAFSDMGIAIILLTAIIKLILWPLNSKSIKAQKQLQDMQPKLDALKEQFKDDKVGLSQATMEMYKEHKINPFSSCFPLLIQFPFLIAVYQVFRDGVNNKLDLVYPFINHSSSLNMISFGFLDLSKPNIYLAAMAGLAQFWQTKMMMARKPEKKAAESKDENMAAIMSKQMMYFMPAITVFIGISLPGGLTLYWFILTIFTALQQLIIFKHKDKGEKAGPIEGEIVK